MKKNEPNSLRTIMQWLESENWTTRYDAISKLEHIPAKEALPVLTHSLLNDENKFVRQACVEVLSKIKSAETVDSLIFAMQNDSYYYVAELCAMALGEIGDAKALEPIIEIIEHKKGIKKYQYITALGKFKDKRAIPILAKNLKGIDPTMIFCVSGALSQIVGKDSISILLNFLVKTADQTAKAYVINALATLKAKEAVVPIFQAISPLLEVNVIRALNEIGDYKTYLDLLREATDRDKIFMIRALNSSQNEEVFNELERIYRNTNDMSIKLETIKIMGSYEEKRYRIVNEDFVLNLIANGNWKDLNAAGKQNEDILIEALQANDDAIKLGVIRLLGNFKSLKAVSFLVSLLGSDNQQVRTLSALSLGNIGDASAVTALINALGDTKVKSGYGDWRKYVVDALAVIADPKAVVPLNKLLLDLINEEHPDEYFIKSVIQALSTLKSSISKEVMLEATRHKKHIIRHAAAKSIEALKYFLNETEDVYLQIANKNWESAVFSNASSVETILCLFDEENLENQKQLIYILCNNGNLKATETVLKWLYKPSIQLSADKIAHESEKLDAMFGSYTEIILYTSAYLECTSPPPNSSTTEYHYDFSESLPYIQKLAETDTQIANNLLHLIIQKLPVELLMVEHEEYYSHYENFGFDKQIELANSVLRSKNYPKYSPEAFLIRENWQI